MIGHKKTRVLGLIALFAFANAAALSSAHDAASEGVDGGLLPDGARTHSVSAPAPRTVTVLASGDVLIHSELAHRALAYGGKDYDFTPMYDAIRPLVSEADLAVCHLETPLSPDNSDISSYPLFNVPHQLADALAFAGYDACSTASNHSLDQGTSGIDGTLAVLDREGIVHYGMARAASERKKPVIVDAGGIDIGLLSYTYGLNGFELPEGEPWRVNLIDARAIVADARRAQKAGAEIVILSAHWGAEYQVMPMPDQVEVARRVLKSGEVDLILGHHAHVVQPIDKIAGRFVVYGMGNQISHQYPGVTATCCPEGTQDGVLVAVTFKEQGERFVADDLRYMPTLVERDTWTILPVGTLLSEGTLDTERRALLRASWDRTVGAVNALGVHRYGVRPWRGARD